MSGAWNLADMEAVKLPTEVADAFNAVTENMVGAGYVPVLYCGTQVVHGVNYMIICKQTLVTNPPVEHLITMIINSSEQGNSVVSIEQIL